MQYEKKGSNYVNKRFCFYIQDYFLNKFQQNGKS